MIVCIAEKPSVGKEIAKILGATTIHKGYMEGNGYQVTWAFGHLCRQLEPDEYYPQWKYWKISSLPMFPPEYKIAAAKDKGVKEQLDIIKKLFKGATKIINCGDAGQEGEVIQRWIQQLVGVHCPVERLWISSLTDEAIRNGFQQLHPQSDYDNLYEAGFARSCGDWLLGMNCTRLYSCKYGKLGQPLSIGRVQTPTLAMIVNRDEEIANFVPKPYWILQTRYKGAIFTSERGRLDDESTGDNIVRSIMGHELYIDGVEMKKRQELPPQLYDLTSLQVDCNKKYGYSADLTLKTLQNLYEKKLTTYPRVDTKYLTHDIYDKCPQILAELSGDYVPYVSPLQGKVLPKSSRVFDDSKVTDHHALMPTGEKPGSTLSIEEKNVYDLIVRRFIGVFYPPCIIAQTIVHAHVVAEKFKVTGNAILDFGWKTIVQNVDEEKDGENGKVNLPVFTSGEHGVHQPSLVKKMTTPPKPYTEATLLQAMETAGKMVEDETLREALKENGIGRPSTRAAIIETLLRRKYVEKSKKNLLSTSTGRALIHVIKAKMLVSPETTGYWEHKLRLIERGQLTRDSFMEELGQQVTQIIEDVKNDTSAKIVSSAPVAISKQPDRKAMTSSRRRMSGAQLVGKTCPECGVGRIIRGKYSYFCSNHNNGCNFKRPL